MSQKKTSHNSLFYYLDWNFERWFGSDTRDRLIALEGPTPMYGKGACAIYLELLWRCAKEGSVPADIPGLAAKSGVPIEVFEPVWEVIKSKFKIDPHNPSRRINAEMCTKRRNYAKKVEMKRSAGLKSAQKRRSGNSNSSNGLDNTCSTPVEHQPNNTSAPVEQPMNTPSYKLITNNYKECSLSENTRKHTHASPAFLALRQCMERYGIHAGEPEWRAAEDAFDLQESSEQRECFRKTTERISLGDSAYVGSTPKRYIETYWQRGIKKPQAQHPRAEEEDDMPDIAQMMAARARQ